MADTLKVCRIRAGLKAREVAQYLGKTDTTISLWENGKRIPDKANLAMMADLYGVPTDFILIGKSKKNGQ